MMQLPYFRRLDAREGPASSALRLTPDGEGGAVLCDLERVVRPSLCGLSEDPEGSAVAS